MKINYIGDGSPVSAAQFLMDSGMLFEINRQILHPLGLALCVDVDEDTGEVKGFGGLWDARDDPEGIIYEPEPFRAGTLKSSEYREKFGRAAARSRFAALGFLKQTAHSVIPHRKPQESVPDGNGKGGS